VPVSVARVASADASAAADDVEVAVRGDAAEVVELSFATRPAAGGAWAVQTVSCTLPASGKATAHLRAQRCA